MITKPNYLSGNLVERFILQNAAWILAKLDFIKKSPRPLTVDRQTYLKNKSQALNLVKQRLVHFNQFYNFSYQKVNIKNQKTRWGSCSKKGNLNFSVKVLFLLPRVANYLIVHELCHLQEFNHSKKFWNLVAQTVPDYLILKKELKINL